MTNLYLDNEAQEHQLENDSFSNCCNAPTSSISQRCGKCGESCEIYFDTFLNKKTDTNLK